MVVQMSVSKVSLLAVSAQRIKHKFNPYQSYPNCSCPLCSNYCLKTKQPKHNHTKFLGKENQDFPEKEGLSLKGQPFLKNETITSTE